jgi:hypothetical protein
MTGIMTGDHGPEWHEILRAPFGEEKISLRPQVWCKACRDAAGKHCGKVLYGTEHKIVSCKDCGQRISAAHLHLAYVGHADVTGRLLEADPEWTWRPMYRDTDPEMYKAVLATGNVTIITEYILNCPPRLDQFGGLWIELVLHDEDGREMSFPGYGDATGKAGANGIKELIGDAVRNAAMRRGVALALWSKADREENDKDTRTQTPADSAGALFDQGTAVPPAKDNGDVKTPAAAAVNPEVQTLADLAWALYDRHADVDELKTEVYDKAAAKRLLNLTCDPRRWEGRDRVPLSQLLTHVRTELRRWHAENAVPAAG